MVIYNLYAQSTFMKPFPGKPLYDRLQQKRLLEPEAWKKFLLFYTNCQPQQMSVDELDRGFKKMALANYLEDLLNHRKECCRKS
jgi:hypothetical protein